MVNFSDELLPTGTFNSLMIQLKMLLQISAHLRSLLTNFLLSLSTILPWIYYRVRNHFFSKLCLVAHS